MTKIQDKIRILSISGGGVWGISELVYVKAIEDAAKKPISELVDYITGTSVGAIIAAFYSVADDNKTFKYDSSSALEKFKLVSDEVFKKDLYFLLPNMSGIFKPLHTRDVVDKLLAEEFLDAKLSNTLIPISMHALSLNGHIPTTFSTLNARANPEKDFYLKDALGASMSAIPMFSPKIIDGKPYIDGAAFANNPVLTGFAELKSHYPEITPEDVIMVSLGTGHYNIPYNASVGHGLFQWILKNDLFYILNYMPALAIQKAASILFPHYHRLEDFVPVELWDISDPANIEPLQKLAEEYVAQNQDKIEAIVADLTAGNSTNRLKFYDQKSDLKSKLLSFASQISDGTKHFASITLDAIKYAGVVVSNSIHDAVAYMPLSSKGAVSFGSASNLSSLENEDNLDLMDILDIVRVCDYDVDFHSL